MILPRHVSDRATLFIDNRHLETPLVESKRVDNTIIRHDRL